MNRGNALHTFLIRLVARLNETVTVGSELLDGSGINDGVDGVHVESEGRATKKI